MITFSLPRTSCFVCLVCSVCAALIIRQFSLLLALIIIFLVASSPPVLCRPQPAILSSLLTDIEFRVGRSQRRHQEDPERRAARRERESRPRQIQNSAADPTGQHEAAHRRVRVYVRTAPQGYPALLNGCLIIFFIFIFSSWTTDVSVLVSLSSLPQHPPNTQAVSRNHLIQFCQSPAPLPYLSLDFSLMWRCIHATLNKQIIVLERSSVPLTRMGEVKL